MSSSQLLQQSITHEYPANGTSIKFNVRVATPAELLKAFSVTNMTL